MNEFEKNLLEIAKEMIALNSHKNAALTGSLMLKVRGYNTRRDASDIDIIINDPIRTKQPVVPDGWKRINFPPNDHYEVDFIQFKKDDMQVDFLFSEETTEVVDGINCGTVEQLIGAKKYFARYDRTDQSKAKHKLDVAFIKNQIKKQLYGT